MSCFITGSGTGVGKTVLTAGLAGAHLAQGKKVCVFKPIQTGATQPMQEPGGNYAVFSPDLQQVRGWVDEKLPVFATYCFTEPVAPYAADAQHLINTETILAHFRELRRGFDVVLIEGAGGVRVPVAPGLEMIDLIRIFSFPVLIAASPQLGTLNAILLTEEALTRRCIEVAGVVISGMPKDSPDPAIQTLSATLEPFLSSPLHFLPEFPLAPGCFAKGSALLEAFTPLLNPEP